MRNRKGTETGKTGVGRYRDNTIHQCLYLSLSTHSAMWEQSVSPDQTSKAEEKYGPQLPTPEEVLSVWGPALLSTQRRLAWRRRWCPGLVRIPEPSSAAPETGCSFLVNLCRLGHVTPQGFSQKWTNIHKYLYNSKVSETSNAFCAKQSRCCEPVLVRMPEQNLVFLIRPFPHVTPTFPK